MMGAFASRAASRAATTVEEDVTFYTWSAFSPVRQSMDSSYDGGDGKAFLVTIFKEIQDIIPGLKLPLVLLCYLGFADSLSHKI